MVIAIVVLLAALLLPALRSAKENANRAICLGNLRQTFIALAGYAGDNRGFLPVAVPAWFWFVGDGAPAYPGGTFTWYPDAFSGLYPNYVAGPRVWLCPSFVSNAKTYNANILPWFPNGTWWPTHYGWLEAGDGPLQPGGWTSYCYTSWSMSLALAWDPGSGAYGQSSLRLGQSLTVQGHAADPQNLSPSPALEAPAQIPLMYDVTFQDGYLSGIYFMSQHWAGRNLGGNVLRGDGHVAWRNWPQWAYVGYPQYIYQPPYE